MLLVVELARSEVELEPKQVPDAVRHDEIPAAADGIGDELDDVGGDGHAGVAEREEHVDAGAESAEKHADDPGTDRVGGNVDVVVAHDGADLGQAGSDGTERGDARRAHLWVRAVVLHEGVLDLDALFGVASGNGGVDIVELVDGQIGIELVSLLKLLQVVQMLDARGVGDGRDLLCLVAPAEHGGHDGRRLLMGQEVMSHSTGA